MRCRNGSSGTALASMRSRVVRPLVNQMNSASCRAEVDADLLGTLVKSHLDAQTLRLA